MGEEFGLSIEIGRKTAARCAQPLAVQLFSGSHFAWFRAGYRGLERTRGGVVLRGDVVVASSKVSFVDEFSRHGDHVVLSRHVKVEGDSPGFGFLTAFEWNISATMDDPWFVPGVWYGNNRHVPPYAIGAPDSRSAQSYIVFREDRLPLPLVVHFDEESRTQFSMAHLSATAKTIAADDNDAPLVDAHLGFGAFGLYNGGETLAFWFPGTEGETTYPPMWTLGRGNSQSESPVNPFALKSATAAPQAWSYRYHPLRDSFQQRYILRLDCGPVEGYAAACDEAWRRISSEYSPGVVQTDLDGIERLSISLLADMTVQNEEATGIPTWIDCFTGKPGRLQNTFGIGFVARNLEAAFLLLKYGGMHTNEHYRRLGIEILDFWASKSGRGLSHTEYDPVSRTWVDAGVENGATFVFLRDQSESHRSCLQAWSMERAGGDVHPQWYSWARSFGDWLLEKQNPDGSFYRAYRLDGTPTSRSTADCAHVIPFLLELDQASGTTTFTSAALRAAEYLWTNFHRHREFFGGTLDNPTCYDKEGSALAFEAYIALFETTHERKWLTAAETAARVCETWIFQWNTPMPSDDEKRFFAARRTTVGFQLITTGFSAFDMYLTRHVREYARLAEYTRDSHYLEVADMLLHNTKCTIQLQSEYGYARPGFQIEHWSMGRGRGYGINSGWLPWVTTSHLLSIDAARREFPPSYSQSS
jgi:hypothetical protein